MKPVSIILAAAAVSGLTFAAACPTLQAATSTAAPPSAQLAADAQSTAHQVAAEMPSEVGIRKVVGRLTEDALQTNDMSKLAALFAQPGQGRIMKSDTYSQGYGAKLDAQIDDIAKAWNEKYGQEFAVSDAAETFTSSFLTITEGAPAADSELADKVLKAAGANSSEMDSLSRDQAIALAQIRANNGLPAAEVPFVYEGSHWRIYAPQTLTATRLRANLLREFTALNNHFATLPANETDACRRVSHRVLLAVMDIAPAHHEQANAKTSSAVVKPTASVSSSAATPATVKPVSASGSSSHWWKFWNWL